MELQPILSTVHANIVHIGRRINGNQRLHFIVADRQLVTDALSRADFPRNNAQLIFLVAMLIFLGTVLICPEQPSLQCSSARNVSCVNDILIDRFYTQITARSNSE